MTLLLQDTFTDVDATWIDGRAAVGHVPDAGYAGPYIGNFDNGAPPQTSLSSVAKIQGNRAHLQIGPFYDDNGNQEADGAFSDYHTIALVPVTDGLSTAKEIRADVFPIASAEGSIIELLWQYKSDLLAAFGEEYYAIHLRRTAVAGQWAMYGSYGPYRSGGSPPAPYVYSAPSFSPLIALLDIPDGGAGLRVGATRYEGTRLYDFWYEPAGGGARTFVGTVTFPNYADAGHVGAGFAIDGHSQPTTIVEIDNLEVDTGGTNNTPPPPLSPEPTLNEEVVGMLTDYQINTTLRGKRLGGGGSVYSWYADVRRWLARRTVNSDNFYRTGVDGNRFPDAVSAFLLDGRQYAALIARDEVRVVRSAVAVVSHAFWGQFYTMPNGAPTVQRAIGFLSSASALPGNWRAYVTDMTDAVVVDHDLGVSDDALHELELIFDGLTAKVRWAIDGVVLYEAALPANVGGVPVASNVSLGVGAACSSGFGSISVDFCSYGRGGLITAGRP